MKVCCDWDGFPEGLQVSDFPADSAAPPATRSLRSTVIPTGNVNFHCNASGAFPAGEFITSRSDPDLPGAAADGGMFIDCGRTADEISNSRRIAPAVPFTRMLRSDREAG